MKFFVISALFACAAAYGAAPAPAAYPGVTPVAPAPFAMAVGKCNLARFTLAPHPGSPLAVCGVRTVDNEMFTFFFVSCLFSCKRLGLYASY